MADDTKSLQEVMEYAIAKEQVARSMYEAAAEEVKSATARRVLEELAEAETGHEKALRGMDLSHIPERTPANIKDLRIAEFLEDVDLDEDADLQTVLVYAIKREEKSRDFYQAMAETCQEAEGKKLFLTLAAQEQAHKHRLEALYDDEILSEN